MQITRITILFATRATQHNTEWMSKIYLESVSFWWFDNFFSTSIPYWINITTDKRKKHWDKYERFGRVSVIIQFYDCRPRSANELVYSLFISLKKIETNFMQVATCYLSISNSRFYSGTKISYVSIYKVCANTAVILQDFANGGPKEFVRVIQT